MSKYHKLNHNNYKTHTTEKNKQANKQKTTQTKTKPKKNKNKYTHITKAKQNAKQTYRDYSNLVFGKKIMVAP